MIELDIVGNTIANYKVLSYNGCDRKKSGKGFNHYYTIEFLDTKNRYVEERTKVRKGKCKDLKKIKLDNSLKKQARIKQQMKLSKKSERVYKKFDFKDKIVLSLDLSTTSTGICITHKPSWLYTLVTFKDRITQSKVKEDYVILPPEDDIRKRCFQISNELIKYIKWCDIVILEDTYPSYKNIEISNKLSELRGFILGLVMSYKKEFEIVSPSSWKNYYRFTGERVEQKLQAIKLARHVVRDPSINSDDVADSILLLNWAFKNLQEEK